MFVALAKAGICRSESMPKTSRTATRRSGASEARSVIGAMLGPPAPAAKVRVEHGRDLARNPDAGSAAGRL
jgi:hypothetical protein